MSKRVVLAYLVMWAVMFVLCMVWVRVSLSKPGPQPQGQYLDGGVYTTCHGMDRVYQTRQGGISVIHNDTSCDSAG